MFCTLRALTCWMVPCSDKPYVSYCDAFPDARLDGWTRWGVSLDLTARPARGRHRICAACDPAVMIERRWG